MAGLYPLWRKNMMISILCRRDGLKKEAAYHLNEAGRIRRQMAYQRKLTGERGWHSETNLKRVA